MTAGIHVNNNILLWAITRAGYAPHEFFGRFPRAKDWLENRKEPTIPQLRDFAKKLHLPFGYLFLEEPPEEPLPIPFFRTGRGATSEVSLNVRDTILTLQNRQTWLREYLQEDRAEPTPFVGRFAGAPDREAVVSDIRKTLGLAGQWAEGFPNWEKALKHLIEASESAGIFVDLNSIVDNNTHRPIPVKDCRGFVLVDEYAPFMFVNSGDAKAARMFTIAHELAHIWIGRSAGFDFRRLQPADDPVEIFCDQVAAEFLVPAEEFREVWREGVDLKILARRFKVSQIVIARRALDLGVIGRQEFYDFYDEYVRDTSARALEKPSGGDFYSTLKNRLNVRFLATVNQAVKEGKLLHTQAFQLTGLRRSTYEKALQQLHL